MMNKVAKQEKVHVVTGEEESFVAVVEQLRETGEVEHYYFDYLNEKEEEEDRLISISILNAKQTIGCIE